MSPAVGPHILSARGEQEWVRLRRHLDRSNAFWLGFVLTEDARAAQVLLERVSANRRGRAERFVELRASDPTVLGRMLDAIEADGALPRGCTWVTAPLLPDPEWLAAWRRLLLSLNHRRDVLRDRLGGLVIVAPAAVKVDAQRESPDLWSVRDLLVELPIERAPGRPTDSQTRELLSSAQLVRSSTAGLRLGDTDDEEFLDEVAALLVLPLDELGETARGRAATATETALAGGDAQTAAVLLLHRALAAEQAGDRAAALDLVRAGSGLAGVDEPTAIQLADSGRRITRDLGDLPAAHAFALGSLRLHEASHTDESDAATMRDLAWSLAAVGDLERDLSGWAAARDRYARALDLQEAVARLTDTAEARLATAMALVRCGDVEPRFEVRQAHYERAVRVAQAASDELDTPEARSDLSVALSHLGLFEHIFLWKLESARGRFLRALELSELVVEQLGNAEAQRDLAAILARLGDIEFAAAWQRYLRSLELQEELAQRFDTPAVLSDLVDALQRLGAADLAVGDRMSAWTRCARALGFAERLARGLGTAGALSRVESCLTDLGYIESQLGDLAAARGRYSRSVEIATQLAERSPSPDEANGLLVRSIVRLGDLEYSMRCLESARVRYLRAVELIEGRTWLKLGSDALRDVAWALERLAALDETSNDAASARDRYASALAVRRTLAALDPSREEASLAWTLGLLANAEWKLGNRDAAHLHLAWALRLNEQRAAQQGTVETWVDVSYTLAKLVELTEGDDAARYRTRLSEVEELLERLDQPPV